MDDDADLAIEYWLRALEAPDGHVVARAAQALFGYADRQREDLDEDIVDRIRSAVLEVHDKAATGELLVVLAEIAERRGDPMTLGELFGAAQDDDVVAKVGLRYARALRADREMVRAREVLDIVLDQAEGLTRGRALVIFGRAPPRAE